MSVRRLSKQGAVPEVAQGLAGVFVPRGQLRASHRRFSTSIRAMAASKIDGTAVAKRIREKLRAEILERQKANPRFQPSLKIVQGAWCSAASWSG